MDDDRSRLLESPFVLRAARWGVVAWALIGLLVLAIIFFRYVILPIQIIFPPLVIALIFVYVLNPVVSWLGKRGIPRLLGTFVTYLILLSALGMGIRFLIPVLVDQVEGFTRSLPGLLTRAQTGIEDVLQRFGIEGGGTELAPRSDQILNVAEQLFSLTKGLLNVALIFVLGLILGFYLLVDLPKIKRGASTLIPASRRASATSLLRKVGQAIGGFFRGQLLVALFVGVASTLALYIVGLPYWALVGMISGLFNLIPLIGPFIGGAIAVFVAFTTNTTGEGLLQLDPGWPLAIGSVVALTIVQQIDNHIISPNVVARTVKLHPVTVMLALLAGGTLMGLWGMLLAVPTVASVKILILHAWDTQATWPPPPAGEVRREAPDAAEEPPGGASPEPSEPGETAGGLASRWRRRRAWQREREPGGKGARPGEPAEPEPAERP